MSARFDPAVTALLDRSGHAHRADIDRVRRVILGADPAVAEGVKWNSASYRLDDWFATIHLRAKDGVQLILHFGAKKRDAPRPSIPDPRGLLEWKGDDRAIASLGSGAALKAAAPALKAIVRAWIAQA